MNKIPLRVIGKFPVDRAKVDCAKVDIARWIIISWSRKSLFSVVNKLKCHHTWNVNVRLTAKLHLQMWILLWPRRINKFCIFRVLCCDFNVKYFELRSTTKITNNKMHTNQLACKRHPHSVRIWMIFLAAVLGSLTEKCKFLINIHISWNWRRVLYTYTCCV